MAEQPWKPHATVAAICERDGKYLLVRERIDGQVVFNQPAGHIEPGESVLEAVVRETREETGYAFRARALLGIYRYQPSSQSSQTYLRFAFRGEVGERVSDRLDADILAAEWLDYAELLDCRTRHRSPMVLQCIDDYRAGHEHSLDAFSREFA